MSYTLTTSEVLREIARSREIHPGDFHNAHEGHSVIEEEYIELRTEVFTNPIKHVSPEWHNDVRQQWRRDMRKEAIQLAAMAVRFAVEVCGE